MKLGLFRKKKQKLEINDHPVLLVWGCSICLVVLALIVNLYRLGVPGIWFDEAFSVQLARQPLPLLLHIIFGPEPNMELYYILLHFWISLNIWLGNPITEFIVRFPSAIFATLGVLTVFLLGKRFFGLGCGLFGAFLFLLNIHQVTYAQQARAYSLQILLLCISWYALFAVFAADKEKPVWRWWLVYTLAMVLAIYAQLFSLLVLFAQIMAVAGIALLPNEWRERVRTRLRGLVICLVAMGVGSLLLVPAIRGGAKTGWLPVPVRSDFYRLFDTYCGHNRLYFAVYMSLCALSIGLLVVAWLSSSRLSVLQERHSWAKRLLHWSPPSQTWPVIWSFCCWLVIPVVVSYIVSQSSLRLFSSRYLVTIVPALFLLIGIVLSRIPWRIIRLVVLLLCLIVAVAPLRMYYESAQIEDWNSIAPWIEARYQANDGVFCYNNDPLQGCQIATEFYFDRDATAARFSSDAPGAFSWERFGPVNPEQGFDSALDPMSIARFAAKHQRMFFIVGRVPSDQAQQRVESTQRWLRSHYHYVDQLVTPTVTVTLYMTE
jgi:uncharacterized membrane protein